jgi:hypothetical protein
LLAESDETEREIGRMSFKGFEVLDESLPYTGRELRSGWVREKTGAVAGGSAVAWVGPCRVDTEDLVDLDDARNGAVIEAANMAHVVVEHPGCPLQAAVLRQRLLVCILGEALHERGIGVRRNGDDLYVGDRKLTVSIAAPAREACLIHLGINVDPTGAPVRAVGLDELGVPPRELLQTILARYRDELATAAHAEVKVRSVP